MVTCILLMHVLRVVEHVIALKTSFLQITYLVLYHCIIVPCEYIQSTDWLATGYLIGQTWKNRSSKKSSLETNMQTRMLPNQNACRVKADGMGPSY